MAPIQETADDRGAKLEGQSRSIWVGFPLCRGGDHRPSGHRRRATFGCSFFCRRGLRSSNRWRLADFKHDFAPRDGRGCQASTALDDGVDVESFRTSPWGGRRPNSCRSEAQTGSSIATGVRPAKAGAFCGSQSHRGKSRSPVAWVAGSVGTVILKPTDNAIVGMAASHQAVAQANEWWPRNFQRWRPGRHDKSA